MSATTDSTDAALLGVLQETVPFTERPFADLGKRCGLTEDETLARVKALKEARVIRQISAIFDTRSLGYASSLVAAKIAPEHLDAAVGVINSHPGVSHNYLRNHEFNLWYTIAIPPVSNLGLEGSVDLLHRLSGAETTRLLPTLRLFKIGVRFDVEGDAKPGDQAAPAYTEANRSETRPLTDQEIQFVRVMQRDIPLVAQPFMAMAEELGLPFGEAAAMHGEFLSSGRMRRFAAVLHHRKAGFGANAMGVWAGPQDDPRALRALGETMAGFRAVSHCYQRPSYADWPYNLFTMVHGKSEQECEQTLAAIAEATGISDRHALYSTREFKKVRVRYFTDEETNWEERNA
ncbi:MAG: AsnC family transcriptional regulator [Luteolibacter sp.]|jgi:DNA-binding Lrp family transcriptional regulator|nr:AsnC family transcriptional regulator [Luteolibacter sp.]